MPRTPQQNEQIRAATKAAILDAAMTCFARGGFAHTTMRHIAAEAGVSSGLTYHYFDSKETLLAAVFDRCMGLLSTAFEAALAVAPPAERLPRLLRAIFVLLETDREFWGLFYMLRNQPAVLSLLGEDFRLWTGRLRDLFTAGLATAGRPAPVLEALVLYSLVEGTIQQYLLDPDHYPLPQVVERIVDWATGAQSPLRRA